MASRRKPRNDDNRLGRRSRSQDCSAARHPCTFRQSATAGSADAECTAAENCLLVQALAGLSLGLVLMNPTGRVVWLNRAAETMLGVSAPQCIGQPIGRVLKDPQLASFWHEVASRDGDSLGDFTVRWPKSAEFKVNSTRCFDHSGAEIGRALLFCDVTDERAVQVQLSHAVATRLLNLAGDSGAPLEPAASLTPQELRILRLVGRGLGNAEIAAETGISPSTVRSHLKSVYRKLALGSRAGAISYAVRNRLV